MSHSTHPDETLLGPDRAETHRVQAVGFGRAIGRHHVPRGPCMGPLCDHKRVAEHRTCRVENVAGTSISLCGSQLGPLAIN